MTARAAAYGGEGRRMAVQVLVDLLGSDQARVFRREIHSTAYQRLQEPISTAAYAGGKQSVAGRTDTVVQARYSRGGHRPRSSWPKSIGVTP